MADKTKLEILKDDLVDAKMRLQKNMKSYDFSINKERYEAEIEILEKEAKYKHELNQQLLKG